MTAPKGKIDAHAYVDPELYDWLRRAAFEARVSISEYIKRLIVAARKE